MSASKTKATRRESAPKAQSTSTTAKRSSFQRTMRQVQSEMPLGQRLFSKFIHLSAVEKISDLLSATAARPNALLSGAIGTFVITLIVYLWARHEGYPLSGFEAIGAFIAGWLLGILFDFLRTMITGKR